MIEQIMLFGIGFLVASLFNLVLVPLVHNRAVRLTRRRLEDATPFSIAEIQAEKDQLRAEFAMSTRRLEMSVEQLKSQTASQLGEIGKKTMAINKLKQELSEKAAAILAIEAREASLRDQLRATEKEFSLKSDQADSVEQMLAVKEGDLNRLLAALDERAAAADEQRIEIAAFKTQIETLKAQIERTTDDLRSAGNRLDGERRAVVAATSELAQEREKSAALSRRIEELEGDLTGQSSESQQLTRRVRELEDRLTEQGRQLVEREYELRKLRDGAERESNDARVVQQLQTVREENNRLKQDLETARQSAAPVSASERDETAVLRDRITDVAAEVARLTLALEGADSPIHAILANAAPMAPAGSGAQPSAAPLNGPGDLIARIKALQSRAAKLATAHTP